MFPLNPSPAYALADSPGWQFYEADINVHNCPHFPFLKGAIGQKTLPAQHSQSHRFLVAQSSSLGTSPGCPNS